MNRISFDGRIGGNAEVKFTPQGKAICSFNVASDVGFGDKKTTNWFRCQIWGERGEKLSQHLSKGQQVTVYGMLELREWEKDGVKRISPDVRVDDITLQGGKPQQGEANSAPRQSAPQARKPSNVATDFDDMGEPPF